MHRENVAHLYVLNNRVLRRAQADDLFERCM